MIWTILTYIYNTLSYVHYITFIYAEVGYAWKDTALRRTLDVFLCADIQ
jgi:hypothetical protein